MPRPIALSCLALLCLMVLAWAAPARAQTDIHHCIGANGGPVFTDKPCAALNATPAAPVADMASPTTTTAGLEPAGTPPVLCATDVDALRQSVIDAFARRDTVRMAGLILWNGYGRSAAIADIRALATLMKQPLLDVETPRASAGPASEDSDDMSAPPADAAAPGPGDELVLYTSGGRMDGAAPQWRFDIVRQAGCLWLRSAN